MTILQALVLGIIQGITEFLPVSSSGHLILFPELLGWELQDVAFDAMVHLATLLAVVIYFWKDIVMIVRGVMSNDPQKRKLGIVILLATIPAVVVGLTILPFHDSLRTPDVVVASLLGWGAVLIFADQYAKKSKRPKKTLQKLTAKDMLLIGCAQAIALIPGTSRSGITITAGLFRDLDRKTAARFAFLLGIPAIALAGSKSFIDLAQGTVAIDAMPLIVGFFAAFVSGLLAISLLLKILEKVGYSIFGWYRIILAVFIMLVLS